MKKNLYVISGWCDTTGRAPYQRLLKFAVQKGYTVHKINPEWDEPLSKQIFPVTKFDMIFGFSMGAVLACMVGQKYPHKKLLLASMTPVRDLSKQTMNMLGKSIAEDCKKFEYGGVKATYFYGQKEIDSSLDKIQRYGIKIIPNVCHILNNEYIDKICSEL